ncbi:PorP/SprF family type IX secretion system membrane protein [Allomuricauda sp.]|uniref:PorP/SprF family type IX secretion system membrane protein n=1 Tax=Flagellimonas sp. TaxID=2058762 RepID=UPI001AFCD0BD|nr:type IX secretion system membrane protein PorP/SprF [Allomuricauda sp.]MBO6829491.1 type IX secretion system membrane protein PorP/SprF [Allomuricauda sp.]
MGISRIHITKEIRKICLIMLYATPLVSFAQQDPQFTQYMYNTMSVNPAFAGSNGHLTALLLHRSQWVGLNGAPNTQVLAVDTPMEHKLGLGGIISRDALGPSSEISVDGNVSYTIQLDSANRKLSFGMKLGGRIFDVDFSRGLTDDADVAFQNNIKSKFFPTIGAGLYYDTKKGYLGFAIPNFFSQKHYDGEEQEIAAERLHYYFIGGKVVDLTPDVKLKPAFFVKWVPGAPIIADVSVNAMLKETFLFGLAYRWDDSFSTLLGMQIDANFSAGYAYDLTTSNLANYSGGSHELFVRYEFKSSKKKQEEPTF